MLTTSSLHVRNVSIKELWELDVLGITDPLLNENTKENFELTDFKNKMKILPNGRYEVKLPWKCNSENLPTKIIELIPGRDGEIRTVRLKTQHGTVIRPVQRIFPLEVQAITNSDKELKEESVSVKSTKPEKVLNINDAIIKKYTSSGRLVKEPKRLDLLNYNCYRFETLPKSQRGEYVVNGNDLCE
ncbi:DUF5641 domain-containing protein [Trichonephila clavipes]|nr:DUF5641 domain-containing protein [Trichonephila clavipes]